MGLIVSRQKAYNLTVTRPKRVIFTLKKFRVLQIISADIPRAHIAKNL